MLNIVEISSFEDRMSYLINQPGMHIVSDIKSKLKFQNFLLNQNPVKPVKKLIVRSNDLFCDILNVTCPEYSIISSSHLFFLFKTWSENRIDPHFILKAIHSYLPILIHPSSETYEQWIENQPFHLKDQRKNLFELIKNFFKKMEEWKMIEISCIKYLLIDRDLSFWNTPLTVDLSFSLDSTEAELFYQLSFHQDVTLLKPKKIQHEIYRSSDKIYSLIEEKSTIHPQIANSSTTKKAKIQVKKFQTKLSEIQFITEKLRQSLDSGFKPHQLAVVAPNIENYWPCMKKYFEKEGLPFEKGQLISLLSFPQIQKWLSSIRFYSNHISFSNLENSLLSDNQLRSYSKIKNQYYYCDRLTDLENSPFIDKIEKTQKRTLDEFLKWILVLWAPIIKKHENKNLNEYLHNILTSMAVPFLNRKNLSFNQEDWIEMLEHFLSQKELRVKEENFGGIPCISLNAIASLQAEQVYFIGLDHDSCRAMDFSLFSEAEAEQILTDLGFYCLPKDPFIHEYEIIHFLHSFKGSATLSWSQTDFNSSPLTPSKLWLIENQNNPPIQTTEEPKTVWHSIQQSYLLEKNFNTHLKKAFERKNSLPDFSIPTKHLHLSPSRLKDYITCPFIFLSKYIFHLEDENLKDMDLNPMDQGRAFHDLFHKIIKNKIQNPEEIKNLIESMKHEFTETLAWPFYREMFLKTALRFLENEKKHKKLFPEIKTVGTEISFTGYWNFEKKSLDSTGDILIKGRIDRIDINKNQILIIDYKSKNEKTLHYWANPTPDCQMPIYVWAVESGLIPLPSFSVCGSIYLSYKSFESKGFVLKNSSFEKIPHLSRYSTCEKNKKEEIFKKINQILHERILLFQKGFFHPQPLKKSTCERCQWNKICQAPHLN